MVQFIVPRRVRVDLPESFRVRDMAKIRVGLIALPAMAALCLSAAPSLGQGSALAALDKLAPGSWELRFRPDNSRQRICIRDGRELIQLRHPQAGCSRFVIEDTANRATVQYTCRGHGYGRTQIWSETPNIAQIEGQGLVDGQPFQFSAEARRVGSC
jgi:hypothetical protein